MKKVLSLLLAVVLLFTGCSSNAGGKGGNNSPTTAPTTNPVNSQTDEKKSTVVLTNTREYEEDTTDLDVVSNYETLDDPALLQYVEDSIYAKLSSDLESDDYVIEEVSTSYISQEYLDEVAYNSKSNVFFGYTLKEVYEQFPGSRFVFTLGDDGSTIVEAFEEYDDSYYTRILKNVAIGTGVIVICVSVSVLTAGTGTPSTISLIFAAAAKTGTSFALSSGLIEGAAYGVITGIQTGDMKAALKEAALKGSNGFKWGAISGAILGGASKAYSLRKAAKAVELASKIPPTSRESELEVLRTYGGREQVSFLGGKEVPLNTPGSTRPDVWRQVGDHFEAIEVKNYNLNSNKSLTTLYSELERQVSARIRDLPAGSTQRIVLDTRNRGFTQEVISKVVNSIQEHLSSIYPNIPIDVIP